MSDATFPNLYQFPTYSRDRLSAIPSLSVCYLNMNPDCDFVAHQKEVAMRQAWRNPGPEHCRTTPPVPAVEIFTDRLGFQKQKCCN